MKYRALPILHTHLAVINFCFNQDIHKQTMHDVKLNINNNNCHELYSFVFYVNLVFFLLVKFYLHE